MASRCIKLVMALVLTLGSVARAAEVQNILFVVDNGQSMAAQRAMMKGEFPRFLRLLGAKKGYRIAIATTDLFSHEGQLVTNLIGESFVENTDSDPIAKFAGLVDSIQTTPTSFWEQGLEQSLKVVEKHFPAQSLRKSPLAIVYVSDENDYSCASECAGVEPENNPNWKAFEVDRYAGFFRSYSQDAPVTVYPIVGTLEGSCTVGSYGTRYLQLRSKLGSGFGGSICAAEFSESYLAIAKELGEPGEPGPVAWTQNPLRLPPAVVGRPYQVDVSSYATGETLAFGMQNGPAWLTLSSEGILRGIPGEADLGNFQMNLWVKSGDSGAVTLAIGTVVHANQPPVWTEDPIRVRDANVGELYTVDITPFVKASDGARLVFRRVTGPAWMHLSPMGLITGRPRSNDVGEFVAIIEVTDGMTSSQASIIGRVTGR